MKKKYVLVITLIITISVFAQSVNDAVDLGLSVNWASHNIGTKLPEQSGGFFAWGEHKEKSYYFYDTYEFTDKTVEYQSCIDIGNHIGPSSLPASPTAFG